MQKAEMIKMLFGVLTHEYKETY